MTGCQLNGHGSIVGRYIKIFLFNMSLIFFDVTCMARILFIAYPIATCYWLGHAGIESQWRDDFPVPMQTSPGANPCSCTVQWLQVIPGGYVGGVWH